MTQVYVIKVCIGIVKIGHAKSSQTRLDNLQMHIQKWRPDISLTLLHVEDFGYTGRDGRFDADAERAAHVNLAAQRLPCEWFAANGLLNTKHLGPSEWFKATDDEAVCAVKAGVIRPLPPITRLF